LKKFICLFILLILVSGFLNIAYAGTEYTEPILQDEPESLKEAVKYVNKEIEEVFGRKDYLQEKNLNNERVVEYVKTYLPETRSFITTNIWKQRRIIAYGRPYNLKTILL